MKTFSQFRFWALPVFLCLLFLFLDLLIGIVFAFLDKHSEDLFIGRIHNLICGIRCFFHISGL